MASKDELIENRVSLKTPLRFLKGVGPERFKILSRLGLETMEDLFHFYPRRYEDRRWGKGIGDLLPEEKVCVRGRVLRGGLVRTSRGQTIFRLTLSDGSGTLIGNWFNQPYLSKVFQPGMEVSLYGKAEKESDHFKMVHPEHEIAPAAPSGTGIHCGRITPIYALTEDLSQKGLRQLVYQALDKHLGLVADPLPRELRGQYGLPLLDEALRQIHFPDSPELERQAYRRLVFDEFFLMQLAVQLKKERLRARRGPVAPAASAEAARRLVESLDFKLTDAQNAALREILGDLGGDRPMHRLLQGDVGSGKTVIAAAAAAFSAAGGRQAAVMAPTEVLAQQLFFHLTRMLEPLGFKCAYLAQGMQPAERGRSLQEIRSGEAAVAVGTHALIQGEVVFKRLGLVIVDEQHKFGILQRAALRDKSRDASPHTLLLTATPIPRTLAMTLYGDLDVSSMAERPAGRSPVRTFWVGGEKRSEIYAMVDRMLGEGRQGYVICPLVDPAPGAALKSAMASHAELSKVFQGRRVGLLHGRMSPAEKKDVMSAFKQRKIDLLVSTVVVEVGVDVPNATVMIIENADRFGSAQLHQLRGRVGRGQEQSYCVLFSDAPAGETAQRLEMFASTESGFEIAENDLRLRGAGDIVGERQHGPLDLRIGDLARDGALLEAARREAVRIVSQDPKLSSRENIALKGWLRSRFGEEAHRAAGVA